MKIVEPFASELTNSNMRKQRMEAVLSSWRAWPVWLPNDSASGSLPVDVPAMTTEDWNLWRVVLDTASPIPPRTHVSGLTTFAAASDLSLEDLKTSRVVLIRGPRVATRWLRQPAATQMGGYSWALKVSPETATEGVVALLKKLFREVRMAHDGAVVASEAAPGLLNATTSLLAQAIGAEESSLVRLWQVARVLESDEPFLEQLPAIEKKILASALARELTGAIEYLDVQTDAQLEFFAEGQDDVHLSRIVRDLGLPSSRLTSLLQADAFLDNMHRQLGDFYFDDVAAAFATVADVYSLGEMLKKLPPGRALFSAVDQVCRRRPELVATYVWHLSFHAEGAFALLQLPQQRHHSPGRSVDLTSEWLEVQRLGRELLVLADRSEDWSSVVALGVHDEANAIARRHFGVMPGLLQQVAYESGELWASALAITDRGAAFVDVLDAYLHRVGKRGDAGLVFALRLLEPLREREQQTLEERLARAIVDSYASGLALAPACRAVPVVLCAYGPLLAQLRSTLSGDGLQDVWAKWLRPFDAASLIEQARADQHTSGYSSETSNPSFDVPNIIRAHVEVLIAQADECAVFDDILGAAIDLYSVDAAADLDVSAFAWNALAQTVRARPAARPPVFVTFGRVVARSTRASDVLDRLLDPPAPAHILAYVVLGLADSELVARVRPKLRAELNDLLAQPTGIALGHALELANVLHQARFARDAERFARRVLEIVEHLRAHDRIAYVDAAFAILAGALAQQELWPELVSFSADIHGQAQRQFVTNMRVVALMRTGKIAEAKEQLDVLLAASPHNAMALANRVALHLVAKEWERAIIASEQAKAILPPSEWDTILVNESVARRELGDTFTANVLLRSVSPDGRRRLRGADSESNTAGKSVAASRTEASPPEATHVPDSPVAREAVPPVRTHDVDIAIITALHIEYEAVRDRLTGWTPAPPHIDYPNIYAWSVGTIPRSDGKGTYRVVVAWAGDSGNLRTLHATTRTIDRWRPRYVLFSGIAGGLHRNADDDLKHGDVVVSQTIWHYEYQKVVDGKHVPRARDTFQADDGLVSAARAFDSASTVWKRCGVTPPIASHVPKLVPGMIGSGEKVIDDLAPPFVRAVRAFKPELQAVEMEAAGAAMAIERAHDEGRGVGFVMVRGISDMPKPPPPPLRTVFKSLLTRDAAPLRELVSATARVGAGTATRDNWKPYASAISASFITRLIASGWWPVGPT